MFISTLHPGECPLSICHNPGAVSSSIEWSGIKSPSNRTMKHSETKSSLLVHVPFAMPWQLPQCSHNGRSQSSASNFPELHGPKSLGSILPKLPFLIPEINFLKPFEICGQFLIASFLLLASPIKLLWWNYHLIPETYQSFLSGNGLLLTWWTHKKMTRL